MRNKKMVFGFLSLVLPASTLMLSFAGSAKAGVNAEHICQLTAPVSIEPEFKFKARVDYGYPVTRGLYTYFFFGDTNDTSIPSTDEFGGEVLTWAKNTSDALGLCSNLRPVGANTQLNNPEPVTATTWDPIKISNSAAYGADDGFDVPVDAFNVNGELYMLYDRPDGRGYPTFPHRAEGGVLLTKETGVGANFNAILRVAKYGNDSGISPGKFLNPVAVDSPINANAVTGLLPPAQDSDYIYILGKRDYFHTDGLYVLRILKTALSEFANFQEYPWTPPSSPPVTVEYWKGPTGADWSTNEDDAAPINAADTAANIDYHNSPFYGKEKVTYYSVQWLPQYEKWLAVYATNGNDLTAGMCTAFPGQLWGGQTVDCSSSNIPINPAEQKIFYSMSDTLINGHWTTPVSALGDVASHGGPYCDWVHVRTEDENNYCTDSTSNPFDSVDWFSGVLYGVRLLPPGFVDANPINQPTGLKHFFVVSALNPYQVHLMGLTIPVPDPGGHRDGDDLTNLQEYLLGTSPTSNDTDGDGVNDNVDPYPVQTLHQTITLTTAAPLMAAAGSSFTVAGTASSGLAVNIYSSGGCTGSGTGSATITMSSTAGASACTVIFSQGGNADYYQNSGTSQVVKFSQTITFGAQQASRTFVANGTFTLNPLATASSGLPVSYGTYMGLTNVCRVNASTGVVTMVNKGTCMVIAAQSGNANWYVAGSVLRTTTLK